MKSRIIPDGKQVQGNSVPPTQEDRYIYELTVIMIAYTNPV